MITGEILRIRTRPTRGTYRPIAVNEGFAGMRSPDLPGQHADNPGDMQSAVYRATVSPFQRRRHAGSA